jgi:hypothetical protein
MGKDHLGHPSGVNKSESGTGIPARLDAENRPNDVDKTEKYTDNDERVSDNVRQGHPNRNTDKGKSSDSPPYS